MALSLAFFLLGSALVLMRKNHCDFSASRLLQKGKSIHTSQALVIFPLSSKKSNSNRIFRGVDFVIYFNRLAVSIQIQNDRHSDTKMHDGILIQKCGHNDARS